MIFNHTYLIINQFLFSVFFFFVGVTFISNPYLSLITLYSSLFILIEVLVQTLILRLSQIYMREYALLLNSVSFDIQLYFSHPEEKILIQSWTHLYCSRPYSNIIFKVLPFSTEIRRKPDRIRPMFYSQCTIHCSVMICNPNGQRAHFVSLNQ